MTTPPAAKGGAGARAEAPSSKFVVVPYRIAACVDSSAMGRKVVAHAAAIAKALDGELTLIRVLETRAAGGTPPDPVEWEIRRRETWDAMQEIVAEQDTAAERVKAQVVEGQPAEQISLWARDHHVDLTVLCTHGEDHARTADLGHTARSVLDHAPGSLLLVPHSVAEAGVVIYRRILVPLDGSCRAESAVPLAVRLARAQRGEVVLVHVVPIPELTEVGPPEAEALELRELLVRRNERVAQEYLDRIRGHVAGQGIVVHSLVLRGGDVRRRLARSIVDEAADLVVLSSHGRSGHADVPHGSIAAYQIAHPTTPLLIVRHQPAEQQRHTVPAPTCAGLRLPDQASP
jgi:nucleotide-binding universal stress UspA family protein